MRGRGKVPAGVDVSETRTAEECLAEARALCKRLRVVWFTVDWRYDPATCKQVSFYKIFRRGMGFVAKRSTPEALVAYLRKQLPPGCA